MATTKTPRRGFLGALLAAPVVAAAPAIAAKAPLVVPVAESPELLALAERLPSLQEQLTAATARAAEANAIYEQMKPALPDELIVRHGDGATRDMATMEMGPDNQPVPGSGGYGVIYVYRWRRVQAHIIAEDISRHTKQGKRLRRIVRLAKAYEAGMAAALLKSNIREARSDLYSISVDAHAVVTELRVLKPKTMVGAMIYVSIAAMIAEARRQTDGREAASIADLAVDAVIRLAGTREAHNG